MEEQDIREALEAMAADNVYATDHSYSANTDAWSDNRKPFVEVHLEYLRAHPKLDPRTYLANLRLRTRMSKRA